MPLTPDEFVDWGSFEANNPDCFAASWSNGAMRNVQLVWAIICCAQAAYTLRAYPRISWEEIFIPLAEVLVYGLQAGNVGYIQQFDGKLIPWVRYMGWIVMFPVLLGQINRVHSYRVLGWNANTILIAFEVLAIVFLISADNCGQGQEWMFIFFAFACYCFVYRIVWKVLSRRWAEFDREGSPEAAQVALKLRLLAVTFFIFWTVFPILKVLGPQTLCVADENVVSSFYLIADMFTCNAFVALYWSTLWQDLDGDWSVDSLKSKIANQLRNVESADTVAEGTGEQNLHDALPVALPAAESVLQNEAMSLALASMKASQMRRDLDSRTVVASGGPAMLPLYPALHSLYPSTPEVSASAATCSMYPDSAVESPEMRESVRSARRELLAMMEETLQRQQTYLGYGNGNVSADVGFRPPQGNFLSRASELAM